MNRMFHTIYHMCHSCYNTTLYQVYHQYQHPGFKTVIGSSFRIKIFYSSLGGVLSRVGTHAPLQDRISTPLPSRIELVHPSPPDWSQYTPPLLAGVSTPLPSWLESVHPSPPGWSQYIPRPWVESVHPPSWVESVHPSPPPPS